MTRQMADDEVLRVFRRDAELAASARAKESTDYSRNRAHESESAIAAVAALQAERDALRAEQEHNNALIQRQSDLLTGAVNVLRGDPPSDTLWSHHDVAELAREMKARAERAESALEALRGQVAGLVGRWRQPTPQDDCTLYTMGQRAGRTTCAAELEELVNEGATDRPPNCGGARRGDDGPDSRIHRSDMTNMTPHDELTALAGKAAAIAAKLPTLDTLEAVDDDARSGRRPCPITLTISEVRDLRALLDSDAFRAMVRDAERLDWLEANGESVNLCSRIVGGYREFRDPIGVSRAAIDAAASGAGEG